VGNPTSLLLSYERYYLIKLRTILEGVAENYNQFPLNVLVKHAKQFQEFEDFSKFYSLDVGHGYYWHITEDPNFTPSSEKSPRDMSSISGGKATNKGLMITSHLEHWYENYKGDRGYAALLDTSEVNPKYLKQVSRGFGNEIFVPDHQVSNIKVVKVYSLSSAMRWDKELHRRVPQSKDSLRQLYDFAHGN